MGLMGGTLRLPLTELSPEYHAIGFRVAVRGRHYNRELLKSRKVATVMRIAVRFRRTPVVPLAPGCGKRVASCKQSNKDYAGAKEMPPLKAPPGLEIRTRAMRCGFPRSTRRNASRARTSRASMRRPLSRIPKDPRCPESRIELSL
jgi:hypothetical protein